MSIRVAIRHRTTYKYDRLVGLSPHTFRLKPAPHSRTQIESYSFKLSPEKHFINWQQDAFGNYLARVIFPDKMNEMVVDVEVIADLKTINPFDFFVDDYASTFPFAYDNQLKKELAPYLELAEKDPLIDQWLLKTEELKNLHIVTFLVRINQMLSRDIGYTIRMEPGVQTCAETLTKLTGSCRDTGWLLVQLLRHLGLAARFVSGYLVQLTADVEALDGPSGPKEDFTDLHAWCEVYIPGAGWIGLDPTSGLFASEGHIPLACTPDHASAAAVSGMTDICTTEFEYYNRVERIREDPRVTKPYSDDVWNNIVATGHKVEEDLQKNDVRLTMGGEPTFVSIDDQESAQWNTAADGPMKRKLAGDLIKRLSQRFAPGGLLHFGQGKWYPGEPLPRWALTLYWRKDALPLWNHPEWLANEGGDYGATDEDAGRFVREMAKFLAVNPDNAAPAYEDLFYFLWQEGNVPVNVDPKKANLRDALERKALAKMLDQGLEKPVGFALPLTWNYENNRWISCVWEFRRNHLFLIPGNSPMGLRLPLKSLPETAKNKSEHRVERSLFEELPALENYADKASERYGQINNDKLPEKKAYAPPVEKDALGKPIIKKESEKEENDEPLYELQTVRKAVCVEARDGKIYIFMPPLDYLEHYLDLLAAVEATAVNLKLPVVIEGYEPPKDPRIQKMAVTPDPGVIEVNIQPAQSWGELLSNYEILFEEARLSRLSTEKFMLDGRHTGTGGGNHITIGGTTPADSPILRNPGVLRSLITYWQHHPGLSYLFSTAFVGPTSQAPRVDEGREEMLYELEIAFEQIPEGEEVPFWLVDRLFRNLLIDITGNTHRAEFCIDKLYSPDSSTGRLGILEFRGFDQPPHYRMAMVQLLLIRALLARFWREPYHHPLVRWGSELHDKFLLPYYCKQDLSEICDDLQRFGYNFEPSWFEPFVEFRFPIYGHYRFKEIELELSMGIEPWNVLGEEMSASGTARFVDSSVERLQLKVSGYTDERYIVTCNGCRIPLTPTVVKNQYVAGIRYRAWQPPSALHPTIGVDTPLVFDIVDTWNNRSVGGCTYHVSHPGGRSYDTYPINSYEAEGRRINRFFTENHTQSAVVEAPKSDTGASRFVLPTEPGNYIPMNVIDPGINSEYPHTLDLRKLWMKRRKMSGK